jgi:hypothetical protein
VNAAKTTEEYSILYEFLEQQISSVVKGSRQSGFFAPQAE